MPQTSRIPTPLKQHLHRFRLGLLPAIAFVFCVLLTLWLWDRQATPSAVVGAVEAYQVDVAAGVAGRIVAPADTYWQLYDPVVKGQVIAQLDDSALQSQVGVINAEIGKLQADLAAAQAEFELEHVNLLQGQEQASARLQLEIMRLALERAEKTAEIEAIKAELQAVRALVSSLDRAVSASLGLAARQTVQDLEQRRIEQQVLESQLTAEQNVLERINTEGYKLQSQKQGLPALELPDLESLLTPIREEMKVQEAMIAELQVQRENLLVTSPVNGVITAIYGLPGQQIQAGTPIVTIARPDAGYVISYVRERQHLDVYEGMKVALKLRGAPGSPEYLAEVKKVGPQVTAVPQQQLTDQTVAEWGTPIQIGIPNDLQQLRLRPGQLVQVIFREPRSAN